MLLDGKSLLTTPYQSRFLTFFATSFIVQYFCSILFSFLLLCSALFLFLFRYPTISLLLIPCHILSSLHSTSLHSTPLHFTSLHFAPLHFTPLHLTSLHSTSLHPFNTSLSLQSQIYSIFSAIHITMFY